MVSSSPHEIAQFDPSCLSGATEVASGAGATVYRAKLPRARLSPLDVAVRRPRITSSAALERFEAELVVRARLSHPHILPLLAACARPPTYCTVSPWLAGGDAFSAVHTRGLRFSFPRVLVLARQLAGAVAHMHARGVVHRDLKSANVLLEGDYTSAFVADLDLAADARALARRAAVLGGRALARGPSNGRLAHMVGTLVYLAPEVIRGSPHSFAADVYALAVTLNELAAGAVPFVDRRLPAPELHTVLETRFNQLALRGAIADGLRPAIATAVPPRFASLIAAAWGPDPASRPSAAAFLQELEAIAGMGEDYLAQFGVAAGDPVDAELANGTMRRLSIEDRPALLAAFEKAAAEPVAPRWRLPPASAAYVPQVSAALSSTCGSRGEDRMEDCSVVLSPLVAGTDIHLLASFDGHGGAACSTFAAAQIRGAVLHNCANMAATPSSALSSAFEQLDAAFLASIPSTEESGATALAALIVGGALFVANAGDCRCILSRTDGSVTALSRDHVAVDPDEAARVSARGGEVVNGRVMGRLLVSRALGDRALKQFVPPTPDVVEHALSGQDDFLVIATDGLWDVVSPEHAAELVRSTVRVPDLGAKRLALKAIELGSGDNISVIVAFLAGR